jgi:hypothetical protein
MTFQESEKSRLRAYAAAQWSIDSHVLPPELAAENLYEGIRASALEYFERHGIAWWVSKWDARSSALGGLPTGHLNSSQVACVNHLEPARVDAMVAAQVIQNIEPGLVPVPLTDGFVEYEWIGRSSYLSEKGARVRGANVTSLDAIMVGEGSGRVLVAIEWKYLEKYGSESVARSRRGTDRVATYRPLLEDPECPIKVEDVEWLFYEPFYQLMRQTLLAWQMVKHGEFHADDWIHLHIIPEQNLALRGSRSATMLIGESMAEKWRSVLKDPSRYRVVTPGDLVSGVGAAGSGVDWRRWMDVRYPRA